MRKKERVYLRIIGTIKQKKDMMDMVEYERFWKEIVPQLFPKWKLPSFDIIIEYGRDFKRLAEVIGCLNPEEKEIIKQVLTNTLYRTF